MPPKRPLTRYWFEFDLTSITPAPAPDGVVVLDGGSAAYNFCARGVGVTGYDERDCLSIIADLLDPENTPPVTRVSADIDVSALGFEPRQLGVSAWRGVWYPPMNLNAPATDKS